MSEVDEFIRPKIKDDILKKEIEPKLMTRYEMLSHFKTPGHYPIDISRPELSSKIRCPVYHDNDIRNDIVFNNYLCACGMLFIFKSPIQRGPGGRPTVYSSYLNGLCPCETCKNFKKGCQSHNLPH